MINIKDNMLIKFLMGNYIFLKAHINTDINLVFQNI